MLIDVRLENKLGPLHIHCHRINQEAAGKADVATMTQVIARLHRSWISRLAWLGARTPRGRLDVGRLSDHLKRDMGFLDGNDPLGRHR